MPVGELYVDQNDPNSLLEKPPTAPSSVPPPTQPVQVTQPVVTKARMADEKPDGSIRDTSMEALRPGNDLGFRNLDDETQAAKTKPQEQPPAEPPAAPPKPEVTAPPEPPKLYAGKYKTAEELEKAYNENNSASTRMAQELAELKRNATAQAATPPPQPSKSPEQIAVDEKAENERMLAEFVANPRQFRQRLAQEATQTAVTALTAQQVAADWRKNNPDIAEHEIRVAFEATLLSQSDPELARNPAALLNKATDNFRAFTGKLRSEGAKEALTTETRVIPLLSNTAPPVATENPVPQAPQTQSEITDSHVAWLQAESRRSQRGLRR